MATYGMSAKDRLALFQNKGNGNDNKPGKPAPKKIGKLNIGGSASNKDKTPVKKKVPAKKPATKPKQEKEGEKTESKPESTIKSKPQTKTEAKPESKTESKPETKTEGKPETKTENKPETKAGTKTTEPKKEDVKEQGDKGEKLKDKKPSAEKEPSKSDIKVDKSQAVNHKKEEGKKDSKPENKEDQMASKVAEKKSKEIVKDNKEEKKEVKSEESKGESKKVEEINQKKVSDKTLEATTKKEDKQVTKEQPKKAAEEAANKKEILNKKQENSNDVTKAVTPSTSKDVEKNKAKAGNEIQKSDGKATTTKNDKKEELPPSKQEAGEKDDGDETLITPVIKEPIKSSGEKEIKSITGKEKNVKEVNEKLPECREIPELKEIPEPLMDECDEPIITPVAKETLKDTPAAGNDDQPKVVLAVATEVALEETPAEQAEEFHVILTDDPKPDGDKVENKQKEDACKPNNKKNEVKPNQKVEALKEAKAAESTDEEVKEILQVAEKEQKKKVQPETEVIMSKTFTESTKPRLEFKPVPEEFYNTLFYFSGMGNVIGTALAEGVYVPEHTAKRAPSPEAVEEIIKNQKVPNKGEEIVKSARTQAIDVSLELKHLQGLLGALPVYSDDNTGSHKREAPKVEHAIKAHTQITDQIHYPKQAPKRQGTGTSQIKPQNAHSVQSAPFVPPAKKTPNIPPPPPFVPKINQAPRNIQPPVQKAPQPPKQSLPKQTYNPPAPIPSPEKSSRLSEMNGGIYSQPPLPDNAPLAAKLSSTGRPIGVHTGEIDAPIGNTPWQQRYGKKKYGQPQSNTQYQNPADVAVDHYNKTIDGTGMKAWQKSHIRAAEARGIYTYVDGPSYDRNLDDKAISDDISSLAPFLTSKKTFSADRGSLHQGVPPSAFQPVNPMPATGNLPYCDL